MEKQLDFWNAFRDYMAQNSEIRCHKPQPIHWLNHEIGRGDVHLTAIISTRNLLTGEPEIRVELGLLGVKAKAHFAELEAQREEIERECGLLLTWHDPKSKNMCKIYMSKNTSFLEKNLWSEQRQWLRVNLELFYKVFALRVQKFDDRDNASGRSTAA
jgi:hypothetical protein